MSEPTSEQAYRAAESELEAAQASGDAARIASAEVRWADAAELHADDLDRAGAAVPDELRARIARYREDTAAG